MDYVGWLILVSAAFAAIERLAPREGSRMLRPALLTDLLYIAFNGHVLGILLYKLSAPVVAQWQALLGQLGVAESAEAALASGWPPWLQLVVALVAIDLLEWCIHNLLHRVPWLWELHKVHHSIEDMDWLGSLRFHWFEVVVYKSLSYPLLAFLGFAGPVLFVRAVVATAIGHWNHANLRVRIGPLRYLINSPEMHIWHHVHDEHGPAPRNFGINLAIWDWIFGTAYIGDEDPERLGFTGIEEFPKNFVTQELHPLGKLIPGQSKPTAP